MSATAATPPKAETLKILELVTDQVAADHVWLSALSSAAVSVRHEIRYPSRPYAVAQGRSLLAHWVNVFEGSQVEALYVHLRRRDTQWQLSTMRIIGPCLLAVAGTGYMVGNSRRRYADLATVSTGAVHIGIATTSQGAKLVAYRVRDDLPGPYW